MVTNFLVAKRKGVRVKNSAEQRLRDSSVLTALTNHCSAWCWRPAPRTTRQKRVPNHLVIIYFRKSQIEDDLINSRGSDESKRQGDDAGMDARSHIHARAIKRTTSMILSDSSGA